MKQERIIINDPRFGSLSYHKKFYNNRFFPGKKFLCDHPFYYIEVRRHGSVNICCPQWNPAEIGNIFADSLEDIWNGDRAQIIRNSIIDGSYSYCNFDTCPKILSWQNQGLMNNTPSNLSHLQSRVSKTPNHVHFVVDNSCNLQCPSCRESKITQLDSREQNIGLDVIRKTLAGMFPEPHNEHKVVSMDGSGEIFSSELYREIFETEDVFTKTHLWPNLKFVLTTNGTMMTEKIQRKYKNFFDHIKFIEVSVDAGDKESYEKVRVGGHWDLLWKNLEYFYSTVKDKPEVKWRWNIIMQKHNYKSLPKLVQIANKFSDKIPTIYAAKLLNWGTWTEEEYLNHAVHLPTHPEHSEYIKIMDSTKLPYGE